VGAGPRGRSGCHASAANVALRSQTFRSTDFPGGDIEPDRSRSARVLVAARRAAKVEPMRRFDMSNRH
jgi:hypothetical protein